MTLFSITSWTWTLLITTIDCTPTTKKQIAATAPQSLRNPAERRTSTDPPKGVRLTWHWMACQQRLRANPRRKEYLLIQETKVEWRTSHLRLQRPPNRPPRIEPEPPLSRARRHIRLSRLQPRRYPLPMTGSAPFLWEPSGPFPGPAPGPPNRWRVSSPAIAQIWCGLWLLNTTTAILMSKFFFILFSNFFLWELIYWCKVSLFFFYFC